MPLICLCATTEDKFIDYIDYILKSFDINNESCWLDIDDNRRIYKNCNSNTCLAIDKLGMFYCDKGYYEDLGYIVFNDLEVFILEYNKLKLKCL